MSQISPRLCFAPASSASLGSGKTTLFQLLTSASEAPRPGTGKADANVGVSRVPGRAARSAHGAVQPPQTRSRHRRVRRHRRAPAARRRAGAPGRRRVPQRRCAAARGPDVSRPVRSACRRQRRSGARRADDGGRADPGGSRRGRAAARAARARPEERTHAGSQAGAGSCSALPRGARGGHAAARARAARATTRNGCAGFSSSRRSRCCSCSTSTKRICRMPTTRSSWPASSHSSPARRRAPCRSARRSSSRSRSSTPPMRRRSSPTSACANPVSIASSAPAYDLLGYISFFTVGEDECRAWSIPRGTSAQCAPPARSTAISRAASSAPRSSRYETLSRADRSPACRDHGELRLEGKEYVVHDGDVINFRHAT